MVFVAGVTLLSTALAVLLAGMAVSSLYAGDDTAAQEFAVSTVIWGVLAIGMGMVWRAIG